jgi:16S rRNA (guanine966-N2)-methyltransferase
VLSEFAGENVRPTSDRAREALFNILALKIYGARVLDLFCGTGAVGIEALSRGASFVQFNDLSKDSIALVKKNLATLKISVGESVRITNYDYATCLNGAQAFDIIFIDPPYRYDYGQAALQTIGKKGLLSDKGVAVYERDKPFEGEIEGLEKYDERRYGKAWFSFFRKKENANE